MTICKRSLIINVAIYKRDNCYIRRFMFFDNVCVKTSVHRIIALTFKHALILFLTIIDYICDLNSIISSYIIFLFYF